MILKNACAVVANAEIIRVIVYAKSNIFLWTHFLIQKTRLKPSPTMKLLVIVNAKLHFSCENIFLFENY